MTLEERVTTIKKQLADFRIIGGDNSVVHGSMQHGYCVSCPETGAGGGGGGGSPVSGACCDMTGGCTITTPAGCTGIYQGDGTVCDPNPCSQMGACCLSDGVCEIHTATDCSDAGGIYQGVGTMCDPNPCPSACPSSSDILTVSISGVTGCCQPITLGGTPNQLYDVSAINGVFTCVFSGGSFWTSTTTFHVTQTNYTDDGCTGDVVNTIDYNIAIQVNCGPSGGGFLIGIGDAFGAIFSGSSPSSFPGVVVANAYTFCDTVTFGNWGFGGTAVISW